LRASAYHELEAAQTQLASAQQSYKTAEAGGSADAIKAAKNDLEDAQVLWDTAYETYKKLPEELDAFGVDEAIDAKVRAWQNARAVGVGVGVGLGVGGAGGAVLIDQARK